MLSHQPGEATRMMAEGCEGQGEGSDASASVRQAMHPQPRLDLDRTAPAIRAGEVLAITVSLWGKV
jgi:hypothetical protein